MSISREIMRRCSDAERDDPRAGQAGIGCLAEARDPERVEGAIRTALAVHGMSDPPPLEAVRVLRVRPGRRCVLRYDFEDPIGVRPACRLIGKIRTKGVNRRVDRLGRALRERGFREGGHHLFSVAEPVGMIDHFSMNLFRWYRGPTLQARIADGGATPGLFMEVGRALAELHADGLDCDRDHSVDDELQVLDRDLPLVTADCPDLAGRITGVLGSAHEVARSFGPSRRRPIHRDFYPDQIIDSADGLILLDLDLYTMGDPMLDVGNFIAHVREQSLRETGYSTSFEEFENAFARGYHDRDARSARSMDALPEWTFLSLIRHLYIAWRIESRRTFVPAILELCEREAASLRAH